MRNFETNTCMEIPNVPAKVPMVNIVIETLCQLSEDATKLEEFAGNKLIGVMSEGIQNDGLKTASTNMQFPPHFSEMMKYIRVVKEKLESIEYFLMRAEI